MRTTLSRSAWILAALWSFTGCSPKPATSSSEPTPATAASQKASASPATPAPLAPKAPAAPALPQTLRVVSWNLEWFPGHKPNAEIPEQMDHMEKAKAALAGLNPDVLLLQEIKDWESAEQLCTAVPGLQVHVASAFQPRPQNQIIASKFPADSAWSEAWQTEGSVNPPRGYSFAAIELPNRHFLLTYSLHLKSNLGQFSEDVAMRQTAARQVLQHSQKMIDLFGERGFVSVIIGGDMNTSLDDPKFAPDQSLVAFKKAGLHWTHDGVPFADRTTIPGKNGFIDNCFDHIFTAGLGRGTASVKAYPGISDHNPVVLDLDLTQADFKTKLNVAAATKALEAKPTPIPATPAPAAPTAPAPAPSMPAAAALDATDAEALKAAVGKTATVRGQVSGVGNTANKTIYFINLTPARGGFVGIVRKDNYDAVAAPFAGDLKAGLSGKTIELTGEVVLYKDAPQIVVKTPDQIKVVP